MAELEGADNLVRQLDLLTRKLNEAAIAGEREESSLTRNVSDQQNGGGGSHAGGSFSRVPVVPSGIPLHDQPDWRAARGWSPDPAVIAANKEARDSMTYVQKLTAQAAKRDFEMANGKDFIPSFAQAGRYQAQLDGMRAARAQIFQRVYSGPEYGLGELAMRGVKAAQFVGKAHMNLARDINSLFPEGMETLGEAFNGVRSAGNMLKGQAVGAANHLRDIGGSLREIYEDVVGKPSGPTKANGGRGLAGAKGRGGLAQFKHFEHMAHRGFQAYMAVQAASDVYDALNMKVETDPFASKLQKQQKTALMMVERDKKLLGAARDVALIYGGPVGIVGAIALHGAELVTEHGIPGGFFGLEGAAGVKRQMEKSSIEDIVRREGVGDQSRPATERAVAIQKKYGTEEELKKKLAEAMAGEREGLEMVRLGNFKEGAEMLRKAHEAAPEFNYAAHWYSPGEIFSMLDSATFAKRAFARTQMPRAASRTGD